MTPEELNRTIEFIIASQARLTASQEQDRQDRIEFQEWSKGLTARVVQLLDRQSQLLSEQSQLLSGQSQLLSGQSQLLNGQSELLNGQSQRLDRQDKFYQDSLKQTETFQKQALHLLNIIIDRLPPGPVLEI